MKKRNLFSFFGHYNRFEYFIEARKYPLINNFMLNFYNENYRLDTKLIIVFDSIDKIEEMLIRTFN